MSVPDNLSRREFAIRLTVGATMFPLADGVTSEVVAQNLPDAKENAAAVQMLLDLVKKQYPDERLDEAGLLEIERDLEQQLDRSEKLTAFPLTNADPPFFTFGAYRKD